MKNSIHLLTALALLLPAVSFAAPQTDAEKAKIEAYNKLCSENRAKFNELRTQIDQLMKADKYVEADKLCEEFLNLYGKDGVKQDINQFKNTIINGFNRKKKQNLPTIHKYFGKILAKLDGDEKVRMINEYANYLTREKLAKDAEIKDLLHTRLQVKNTSVKCQFETYISEGDLAKAEEYAQKYLATVPQDKQANELGYVASKFEEMSLYGSESANKYYKLQYAKITDPDQKAIFIAKYAAFQKRFLIITPDEYDKLMASRHQIPGLSEEMRFALDCEPIDAVALTTERIDAYNKAFAKYKGNEKLRIALYKKYWELMGPEYLENVVFNDPAANPFDYLGTYTQKKSYGRYAQVEQTLAAFEKKYHDAALLALEKSNNAKNKEVKLKGEVDLSKLKLAKAEETLKKADKVALDKARKDVDTARNELNVANAAYSAALKECNLRTNEWQVAFRNYCNILDVEINYFYAIGIRYYDTRNPYCLYRCIDLIRKKEAMNPSDLIAKVTYLADIAKYANEAEDSDTVFNCYKAALEIVNKPEVQKDRNAWIANGRMNYLKKYVAQSYYREGDYQKALEFALPVLEVKDWQLRPQELEEIVARSYVALGELEKALPHAEKMVDAAPNWMRKRLVEHVKDLKERIAEQKK